MKTYEERTADILAKAKEEKSRRRKRIFAASTTLSCVCLVLAAAIIAGAVSYTHLDHFHIDSACGGEPRAVAGGFGNALIPKLHYGIVIADNKAVEAHLLLEELTKQLLR